MEAPRASQGLESQDSHLDSTSAPADPYEATAANRSEPEQEAACSLPTQVLAFAYLDKAAPKGFSKLLLETPAWC